VESEPIEGLKMAMSSAPALLPPKQQAGIQILANLENSMGSWSALDEVREMGETRGIDSLKKSFAK
jgi:hypothetical protein